MKDVINTKQLISKIKVILRENDVKRASLFGSYVRGEEKSTSDVDILVELPKKKGLLDFVDLKLKLEESLNRKVDLVEYSAVKPRLREYIFADQLRIL